MLKSKSNQVYLTVAYYKSANECLLLSTEASNRLQISDEGLPKQSENTSRETEEGRGLAGGQPVSVRAGRLH